MTEQEVRRYLRQMKEEDSERAFHSFYNLCYDRLFRIACYFVKHEEWAQEIVLDVFMKLWEQRARLPEVNNIEDYCFILTLKSATKLFSVLLASKRPLITELADKLRLKYPLLPTISPCPTMRLEAIRSIIPISCRRYPKSV